MAGRDVLMIAPTGSGNSLTFQISPYVIDNFKHGDQQDVRTVCLVIYCPVGISHERPGVFPAQKTSQCRDDRSRVYG